jgi:hypothetical protein
MELASDPVDPRIRYWFPQSESPSTVAGTFDGYSFYLYARWDYAAFTISRTPGIEAVDCYDLASYDLKKTQADEKLRFPATWVRAYEECFYVEVEFKKGRYEGSYLSEARKLALIRDWCLEFDRIGRCECKRLVIPRIGE